MHPIPKNTSSSIDNAAEAAARIIEGISALGAACSASVYDELKPAQRIWITGICCIHHDLDHFKAVLQGMIDGEVSNAL